LSKNQLIHQIDKYLFTMLHMKCQKVIL